MSTSRRTFLKAGSVLAASVVGGLALRVTALRSAALLRPPGAGSQREFLARCIRCSQCVQACPTDVLQLAGATDPVSIGTPFVVARDQPCDLCQGRDQMECIAVCPTDALQLLARREDVRMGTAIVNTDTCFPYVGVSCRACWHACPFPDDAISFDGLGHPIAHEDACVGCGLCEHACLTSTTSIRIVPRP